MYMFRNDLMCVISWMSQFEAMLHHEYQKGLHFTVTGLHANSRIAFLAVLANYILC